MSVSVACLGINHIYTHWSDLRKMSRNDLDFGAMQHVSCITSQIILCPNEKILVLCLFWNVENKSWTEFEACYFLLPNKSASLGLLLLFFSFCLPHGKLRWNSVCAGKKRHGSLLASCIAVEEKQKETLNSSWVNKPLLLAKHLSVTQYCENIARASISHTIFARQAG